MGLYSVGRRFRMVLGILRICKRRQEAELVLERERVTKSERTG